tara:strand:- start:533 stop:712 length:180 start_codon:yes stop_codon:yes gene_type:complete
MGAKTSNAMIRALRLIEHGATVRQASQKTGLWTQSIYQAQAKKRKIAEKNPIAINEVCK